MKKDIQVKEYKHLKVKDLIEELKQLNPDHFVWLSKDSEGNAYYPLYNNCFAINQSMDENNDPIDLEENPDIKPDSIIIYP